MGKLKRFIGAVLVSTLLTYSCGGDDTSQPQLGDTQSPPGLLYTMEVPKRTVIYESSDGVRVYFGGFGSDMTASTREPGFIYLLTDRGPNIDGATSDEKIFPTPYFIPTIGKFRISDNKLILEGLIELESVDGIKLSGIPNPPGAGSTGEIAKDLNGNIIPPDIRGVDPEGLAIDSEGNFWVSDEYGPYIIKFNRNGKELLRLSPYATERAKKLPEVYKKRRPNRGMEGLTITPDGKYLVGMMQSPLENPDSATGRSSTALRIIFYEIATAKISEYIYYLENTSTSVCAIVALTNTTFLVLERDGKTPGKDSDPIIKRIYKIDITGATNVNDPEDKSQGRIVNGKTIEQLTKEEANSAGIKPVSKTLVFDIMSIPNYPHDKPEGLLVFDRNTIGIVNDDDFGITSDKGKLIQKRMPKLNNAPDKNIIYVVRLAQTLY